MSHATLSPFHAPFHSQFNYCFHQDSRLGYFSRQPTPYLNQSNPSSWRLALLLCFFGWEISSPSQTFWKSISVRKPTVSTRREPIYAAKQKMTTGRIYVCISEVMVLLMLRSLSPCFYENILLWNIVFAGQLNFRNFLTFQSNNRRYFSGY